MSAARRSAEAVLTAALRRRSRPLADSALEQSALVFSPHFDDETLGCGGTILRKRALGADVGIVFLTDGRASHSDWIDASDLARQRATEGLAAARALGLEASAVHCLGFEETRLRERRDEAAARVAEILERERPQQVFVPYHLEPPEDHVAAFDIVKQALASNPYPVDLFEYPIWIWVQWPFAASTRDGAVSAPRRWIRRGRSLERLLRDFRWRVDVQEQLEAKRRALAEHRSQVERPADHPDWPTLGDVAGGDFLRSLFRGFEIFTRSSVPR